MRFQHGRRSLWEAAVWYARLTAGRTKALEILGLKGDNYELHCCAEEKGKLASPLLGLEFDLSEVQ